MIFPRDHLYLIEDVESCPYIPKDPEYSYWNEKNTGRIENIVNERKMHIEALEADGFFVLSHDEARQLAEELAHSNLNINHFAATRAVGRMLDLFHPDYIKR